MNPILESSIARITTAIKPQRDVISNFVKTKTFLNGRPFTTEGHEYQDLLMEELVNPDVEFVLHKIAQAGASEIIYRILLAYCANIPGFSAALVLPSLEDSREAMKVRVDGIIKESPELMSIRDRAVDSSSTKRFRNNSLIFALSGSGTTKSTVTTRPIRCIVADELQFINMKTLSSMATRQRHQLHKASIYFSSPRFEGYDIDAEIQLCGHIWENILICERCNHEFFPDFYENVRIPGLKDPIKQLTLKKAVQRDLKIDDTYMCCPKCKRKIPYGHPHTRWVDVAENPNLPKRGMKIGPFDIPKFVTAADLVKDMLRMSDRDEFECQMLAKPISAKNSAMDITQVKFEHEEPGNVNVFGLDIGKFSCMTVSTVSEGRLYIHHIEFIPLKDLKDRVYEIMKIYRCVAGVIDLLPYTEVTTGFINTIPNTWAAVYNNSAAAAKNLEMFSLKQKEDEALGSIRQITINMTPAFDFMVDQLMNGLITYKSSELDNEVLKQLQVMRRVRDYRSGRVDEGSEIQYMWQKPQGRRVEDHIFHSTAYSTMASRLISKGSSAMAIPANMLLSSFNMKKDI